MTSGDQDQKTDARPDRPGHPYGMCPGCPWPLATPEPDMTDIADKCPGCPGCPLCVFVMLRKLERADLGFERQRRFQWKDPYKDSRL